MKKTLLLLLLISATESFAQVNPDLFKTWHLNVVMESDLSDIYEVIEIEPPIRPFIVISETDNLEIIEINGEGACNTFSGTYNHTYDPNYPEFIAIDFTKTQDDCGIQIHNSFESSFFGFMYGGWYEINQDSQGLNLTISNPIFGYAYFTD